MDTNVLDWLEVTAAACPDKPAFLDEDGAVTFADVRREARIIGTAAARLRAGRKAPIAVMSGRNAHTPAVFLGAVYAGCCYAPMDGTMPVHRLNSILHTLDTDLMIVQRAFTTRPGRWNSAARSSSRRTCSRAARMRRCWQTAARARVSSTRCTSSSPPDRPVRPRAS